MPDRVPTIRIFISSPADVRPGVAEGRADYCPTRSRIRLSLPRRNDEDGRVVAYAGKSPAERRVSCRLHVLIWLKETPEYRATVALSCMKQLLVSSRLDGDRFIVVNEHKPENLIYDPDFLGMKRSPDFILIQVTSTVGNIKEQKLAFYRQIADELNSKLGVRPDDVMINMVFVDREDWSFGKGQPW
jgi:hypothetical protein